jgi:hypothetical protein
MVDEMTSKVAKCSRKAWRKRKRMKESRDEDEWAEIERVTDELLGKPPLVLGLTKPPWEDMLPHELHEQWPQWKQRALPLPKYGT